MGSLRAATAWAVLLLLQGCTRKLGPEPVLDRVEPALVPAGTSTAVRVLGENFSQRPLIDYSHPGHSALQGGFTLELLVGSATVPLTGVTFTSQTELSATVPVGPMPGTYALRLTDPWGRSTTLENALKVLGCSGDGDCDDGLSCTIDRCLENHQCQHKVASGQCIIGGSCHASGETNPSSSCLVCDPTNSTTAWTVWPDGHACNDGNACTSGEHCTSGVCGNPTATVSCQAPDACHLAGTCDPTTGVCSNAPAAPDGTPCDDGYACTTQDSCQGGVCRGGASTCANTPPMACLTVTPTASSVGTTVTFDATCSWDLEDPPSALQVGFDFQGDGGFTPLGTARTATFVYPDAGLYQATVEVRDTGGLTAYATRFVSVASATNDLVVTTAVDESDPSATPQNPGGNGLSLREAIAYVNGTGAPMTIRFNGPMTIKPAAPLPPLTADGASIVGSPGVVLDFSPAADAGTGCLTLAGDKQYLIGVEILDCPGPVVVLQGSRDQIAECQLHRGTRNGTGVAVQGSSNTVGPRTRVFDFAGSGIQIQASNNTVDGVNLFHNGSGIDFSIPNSTGTRIQRSQLYANADAGVVLPAGPTSVTLYFNTIHGNGGAGISATTPSTTIVVRDNLLTSNQGAGLCGPSSAYTSNAPNGFFSNDGGTVCQGSLGSGTVQADPLYMAPALGDFRLQPGSPVTNQGIDVGVDVNGPAPGNYNGSAPDLGANESPW